MSKDLGKVVMAHKGAYSATATYENLDTVTYEGSMYCCLKDGTTGHLPTEEGYWFEAARGAYHAAKAAGYTGTEEEYNSQLADFSDALAAAVSTEAARATEKENAISESVSALAAAVGKKQDDVFLSVQDGKVCITYNDNEE